MNHPLRVGIIADFNPKNRYHLATNDSLGHAAKRLGVSVTPSWLDTVDLAGGSSVDMLRQCDAFWAGPSSPYRSMEGALRVIRFAREECLPFLGT